MPAEPQSRRQPQIPDVPNLLESVVKERDASLRRLAASVAGAALADDAVQLACLGFLQSFDSSQAFGGADGAYRTSA
jgi:hypothetical protein